MSFFIIQILCVSCWIRFLVYFVTVNKFELCFIKKLSPLGKVEQRTLILKVFYWQAFCSVTTVTVKGSKKAFQHNFFPSVYCVGIEVKFLHFKCFILHVTVSALWRKSKLMWCFAIRPNTELKMSKLDKASVLVLEPLLCTPWGCVCCVGWCLFYFISEESCGELLTFWKIWSKLQYLCIFHSDSSIRWQGMRLCVKGWRWQVFVRAQEHKHDMRLSEASILWNLPRVLLWGRKGHNPEQSLGIHQIPVFLTKLLYFWLKNYWTGEWSSEGFSKSLGCVAISLNFNKQQLTGKFWDILCFSLECNFPGLEMWLHRKAGRC